MFNHKCHIDDMKIIGSRCNPLDETWHEWTLVICMKCKTTQEWQHHSSEEMHGSDLHVTAFPTKDYLEYKYNLSEFDIQTILKRKKKIVRYDRYKKQNYEQEV